MESLSNDGIKDRLSEMPDQVILHILSLMPTIDAVRSMLIQRFGNLWTLIPALRFDYDEYIGRMTREDDDQMFQSFTRFVRNVLMLHTSTIDTFRLVIRPSSRGAGGIISDQMWLRFATDKKVKHLYVRHHQKVDYPCCLFKSKHLETLKLFGGNLEDFEHQSQPHMGSLRILWLNSFCGSNKALDQLISGCPSLQELAVNDFLGRETSLNITCPSVRKLKLFRSRDPCTLNCPRLEILDIEIHRYAQYSQYLSDATPEPTPHLTVIGDMSLQVVNVHGLPFGSCFCLINPFFRLIQNVEVLTLSAVAFVCLHFIEKMEFPQNRWKRLVLHPAWFESCLEVFFMLMKSSVSLEDLIIYVDGITAFDRELSSPEFTTCAMPLLKTASIHGNNCYTKWCQCQLHIIEFLLANAAILEKLVINLSESKLTTVEELQLVEQVSRFRRVSTTVTVIFVEKHSRIT